MSATGDARPIAAGAGFTLIEMLVALAILALIGGIVFPNLERGLRAHELRGAGIAAATALRTARARAFAGDRAVRLRVGPGGGALLVDGSPPDRLPEPLHAGVTPADGILFFGDGSSSGGTLSIVGATRGFRFVVSPTTGVARSAA